MLNPAQIQQASTAIREMRVALSNFFLYAAGNNITLLSIQRFLGSMDKLFESLPSVTLGESEGRLVVEASPLDERVTGSTNMIKDLYLTHKLHSLTFAKGVTTEEVRSLFTLMRPRALPTGVSLSQALVQQSLTHIRANEKVFVAVSEGEKVVSADAVLSTGDQNVEEAMEALQYFLQIFSRVHPESNKSEIAQKLRDHMGSWIQTEKVYELAPEGNPAAPQNSRAWMEVLGGFAALKNNLANAQQPAQMKAAQMSMDELLKKLVLLGESQGIKMEESSAALSNERLTEAPAEALPEIDPVLAAINEGNLDVFWDPGVEEIVDREFPRLQEPQNVEFFEYFWKALWEKIFAGDEKTQALGFRHLNRLKWNNVPRALQLEGLRNMRRFLSETRRASVYPIVLTLAQDWVPLEMARPDWDELVETVKVFKQLAEKKPPLFDKQNEAAKVAIETIFCEPVLESLLRRYQPKTPEGDGITLIFRILGPRMTPFLFEKIEEEPSENPAWGKAVDFLNVLETDGHHVYEMWLERPEKKDQIGKFLEIFKVIPLTGDMQDYFERHWTAFNPAAQSKILDIVEFWKRSGFRPFLLRLLEKPETPQAFQALQVLSVVGIEGDSLFIAEAVKKYSVQGKDREHFWIKACQTLAKLAEPSAAEPLMEWADKYKFLEKNKKERSLEVRRAAIEALGHFKTPEVKEFLTGLKKDIEKELSPALEQALQALE